MIKKRPRHLILGATGFVGGHVTATLVAAGEQVVIAGRSKVPSAYVVLPYKRFDLRDADWMSLLDDVDIVHHYAWDSILKTAAADPVGDLNRHVSSSVALLQAAATLGGKRVLFTSSGGTVYGPSAEMPAKESTPSRPSSVYGAAKAAVELYMGAFHHSRAVDCRVARVSNPYGTGSAQREQGLVNVFTAKALRGDPMMIWGDGDVVRDYIHVSDVARALVRLASTDLPDTGELPIYNIGSGVGVSINAVVALLERQLGRQLNVQRTSGRSFDVPVSVLDISKAKAELDWQPETSLEEGVQQLLHAFNAMVKPVY